jgi:hypothetical protein
LPKEELERIGAENRKIYLTRKREFQSNLEDLLRLTLSSIKILGIGS